MIEGRPGDKVDVVITYLEMTRRPEFPYPLAPMAPGLALITAEDPPVRWFLHLYESVGRDHEWTDWLSADPGDLRDFVDDPKTEIHTLFLSGWTAGFFMLDTRAAGVCDLAYFGLAPEGRGKGLGGWLLQTALLTAWDKPGVEKVTVNTCTLDEPRALGLYQRHGFAPVRQEHVTRVLSQWWRGG